MNKKQAALFGLRCVETACQMTGVEVADSSVPTVLHPIVGDHPVSTGQVDPRAIWVMLMDHYPDFGPEKWMWQAFRYMLSFSASDADFRLANMQERIPVVKLMEQSLDIREAEAYYRLHRMLFCFLGIDALNPICHLQKRIQTVAELTLAVEDLTNNADGPMSLKCPSVIRTTKDAENVVEHIFAIDFEFWKVDATYCAEIKAFDITKKQQSLLG